eukprot:1148044-Pelagomonas_calceolata.AAC.2
MSLGINGIHELTYPCKTHIITVAQLQAKHSKVNAKCKIALSRQATLVYFSPAGRVEYILNSKNHCLQNTDDDTLAHYPLIDNTHVSGLNVVPNSPNSYLPPCHVQCRPPTKQHPFHTSIVFATTLLHILLCVHTGCEHTGRRLRHNHATLFALTLNIHTQEICPVTQEVTTAKESQPTEEPPIKELAAIMS